MYLISADAAANASGLGFNGYDESGDHPRWDRLSNVHILKIEVIKLKDVLLTIKPCIRPQVYVSINRESKNVLV